MRVRLVCTAVVLGTAGAVGVCGAGAAEELTPAAGDSTPVEPGVYRLVTPGGQCLSGTGEEDVSLWLGPCTDAAWRVESSGEGHVIRHAGTGKCLAPSLVRVYPQRVGTRGCETADERWTITRLAQEGGRSWVRVTRPNYYNSLTWLSDREPVFLLPQSQTGNQRWELQKVDDTASSIQRVVFGDVLLGGQVRTGGVGR